MTHIYWQEKTTLFTILQELFPFFDFEFYQKCHFSNTIKAFNFKLNTLVQCDDPLLLTREDNSFTNFARVIPLFDIEFYQYYVK